MRYLEGYESINFKQRLKEMSDDSLAYLYDIGVSSHIIFINNKYFIRISIPELKWSEIKMSFIPFIQILDDAVVGLGFGDDPLEFKTTIYDKEDVINDRGINDVEIVFINIEVNPLMLFNK